MTVTLLVNLRRKGNESGKTLQRSYKKKADLCLQPLESRLSWWDLQRFQKMLRSVVDQSAK